MEHVELDVERPIYDRRRSHSSHFESVGTYVGDGVSLLQKPALESGVLRLRWGEARIDLFATELSMRFRFLDDQGIESFFVAHGKAEVEGDGALLGNDTK